MIFPERMRQLVAVVLDRDVDAVTRELLAQGVLHFLKVTEVDKAVAGKVEDLTPRVTEAMIAEIRKRIESFFAMAGESRVPAVALRIEDLRPVDLEETNRRLDQFAASIQEVRDRQLALQQEILKLEDIRRQLEMFSALPPGSGIGRSSQYSFLSIQTGTLRASLLEGFTQALKGVPSVQMNVGEVIEGSGGPRVTLLLITMRRDDGAVRRVLEQFGWEEARLPREAAGGTREEALRELEPKLSALRSQQTALGSRVAELVREKRGMLEEIWENLRLNELYVRVQTYFSRTSRTVLFTGWLPANRQKGLEEGVRRAAAGRCYLEWHGPKDSRGGQGGGVPVRFSNPGFLAPFQMLVQNYAVPEYGTVEPTPFVAVAYLIMFGLMFADVGHGLVLAVLAVLGLATYKGQSDNVRNLLRLGVWCGGAAILAGALFGSYFGMQWLRPLWFDFHGLVSGHSEGEYRVKDIYGVLLITIYFGITVIGLGLALNWVNLIAKRHWLRLIFDKGGLLGGWIYAGGVYIAFFYVRHDYHQLPPGITLLLGAGLPALLLFLKAPVELMLHRDKPFTLMTPLDFLMEWILEILEIFSGYLANTLSFMRVAGLGIAHVSLLIAFFAIAGMLRSPGGAYTLGSYLVLVFGNALVIALEGLSAGIQSLRLNYYEFFSKYFSGTGKIYEPVSLRSRR